MSKLSTFDFNKMRYLKPRKRNNMYISKIMYDGNDINIQLKRKITPSGIYREGNKYYIDLIFDDDNIKDTNFVKLYRQLEMTSMKEIYKKYNDWMKISDQLEWEDVYASFRSQLTIEEDMKRIRFNLITNKNMMDTVFFNEELEKIAYKDLEEGDEISMIISFSGIKFGKQTFENLWEVIQVKVYNKDKEEVEQFDKKNIDKCQIQVEEIEDSREDSVDIEDFQEMDKKIEEIYKKYKEEESLKIIE